MLKNLPLTCMFSATAAILLGSTSFVSAQSDLPDCADMEAKQNTIRIIAEDMDSKRRALSNYQKYKFGVDWLLHSLTITYIVTTHRNEVTGTYHCSATLLGRRDKTIYASMEEDYKYEHILESQDYWENQKVSDIVYSIAQSAEFADRYVVTVTY